MSIFSWRPEARKVQRLSLRDFELDPIACYVSLWPCTDWHLSLGVRVTLHDYGGSPRRAQMALLRVYFLKWQFSKSFRRTS